MNNKKKINLPLIVTVGPVSTWMILLVAIPFIYVFAMSFMNKGLMVELLLDLL